jgi:hypothetical protein
VCALHLEYTGGRQPPVACARLLTPWLDRGGRLPALVKRRTHDAIQSEPLDLVKDRVLTNRFCV